MIAWFTLGNATDVSVNFFFVTARTSLIFVILISVLLGMCLMAVLWATHAWKLKREKRTLQRQVATLEEIHNLTTSEIDGQAGSSTHEGIDVSNTQHESDVPHAEPSPKSDVDVESESGKGSQA